MKITIDRIAELAGVSKTTVSRVLNNKPDVKPETRDLIMGLIDKYDYHPNAFAKAITSQKSNSIGLIFPFDANYILSNPFYIEVMRGVSIELTKRDYYLMIFYTPGNNLKNIFKEKRVDGFILMSSAKTDRNIVNSLKEIGAPFVTTAKIPDFDEDVISVDVDNYYGGTLAVEHLISLGHEKIGFIGKPSAISSMERFRAYKDTLKKYNIPFSNKWVEIADQPTVQDGRLAMQKLLEKDSSITAVFLANDLMAIGAIRAVYEEGKRVPEDISLVGFDDIPFSETTHPPLTTIRQPAYEKGQLAAELLIDYIEENKNPSSVTLPVQLIKRKST